MAFMMGHYIKRLRSLAAFGVCVALSSPVSAQENIAARVYRKASNSVVTVEVTDRTGKKTQGSGVVIKSEKGLVPALSKTSHKGEEALAGLNTMELRRACRILDRGVFHYLRIEEIGQQLPSGPIHLVAELCYQGRSLVEVVRGISLWLRSEANIDALAAATFVDMVDHLRKTAIWIEKWKIEPKSPEEQAKFDAIRSLDRKKWSVYYPDGKETIASYGHGDVLAENSMSFFAKLMHADEYSILGVHELAGEALPAYSYTLAQFWQKDFRHEIFLLYRRFPSITSFYETRFTPFPFDFRHSPYAELQGINPG